MQSNADRLHSLDAVRALALLLGVALHAAQPYIAGLPWVTTESPNATLAAIWHTIHMFRMPLFFLIAGFFGHMMLERRGAAGFIKDRSRRILLPLVIGVPVIMGLCIVAVMLGALASGANLQSLQTMRPPASPVHHNWLASINLIHLWFLYYLLIFYAGALVLRKACDSWLDQNQRLRRLIDRMVGNVVRSGLAPFILAMPAAAYYVQLANWSPWGGLPAPQALTPDAGALIAYGSFFGFGWQLYRQRHLLSSLQERWPVYGVLAVATWAVCHLLAGATPHWGPFLKGESLMLYTSAYIASAWCWSFALIGASGRILAGYSPVRRYLADASYWIYLMHLPVLFFLQLFLHPFHFSSSIKYLTSLAGAMIILLLSYRYLVRYTFIGAVLNGRRHRRVELEPMRAAVTLRRDDLA